MKNNTYLPPTCALTEALILALTAPDDKRSLKAAALADSLVMAFNISPANVELAKARALRIWRCDCSAN